MQFAIGVDLGGSHTVAGAVAADGTIIDQCRARLESLDAEHVVDEIGQVVSKALQRRGDKRSHRHRCWIAGQHRRTNRHYPLFAQFRLARRAARPSLEQAARPSGPHSQ